jgi:hypothetical protein
MPTTIQPVPLYFDVVGKQVYMGLTGLSGTVSTGVPNGNYTFPAFCFGDTVPYNVFLMTPLSGSSPGKAPTFQLLQASAYAGLQMALGSVDGNYTDLTWQNTWATAVDPVSGFTYFTASLSIYTAAIQTALGSAASIGTNLQIFLVVSGTPPTQIGETLYLNAAVIKQVVQNPGTANPLPLPASQYLTAAQIGQLYVLKIGKPGDTIQTSSPNGTYSRLWGIDNNGTPID